jgi:hypothetical protein
VIAAGWWLAALVCLAPAPQAPPEHPLARLERLRAAAAAQPQSARVQYDLGVHLADPLADEEAIAVLNRALQLGLEGETAVDARFWIGWIAVWNGRDREAMAAFQAVQGAPLPSDRDAEALGRARWRRQASASQVEAIRRSHAALAGASAAEGRAIAVMVILCLGILGMFWGGRRLAGRRLTEPDTDDDDA